MNRKLNQLIYLVKEELALLLSLGFGVFLFVLFFQPFTLDKFDFNNSLLFVAGLGAIVFVFVVLVRVVFPWLIQKYDKGDNETIFSSFMSGFIIFVLSATAFAFYLHYVGSVDMTIYNLFKVALICLSPPLALRLYDAYKELKLQNESLLKDVERAEKQVEKFVEDDLNKSIEFISGYTSDNLNLLISDIAFIKSADNYVEIAYLEEGIIKKSLIRNTLKNIEQQMRPYRSFLRCHRICIVNTHHIEKLTKEANNHWLTIIGYDEQIPVSRQYLLKFKDKY